MNLARSKTVFATIYFEARVLRLIYKMMVFEYPKTLERYEEADGEQELLWKEKVYTCCR